MGASIVFGNEFFDQWLTQKSNEILSKVEREKMSSEDMLILSLKAQVNHFHHMDIEFRGEFSSISQQFKEVGEQFKRVDEQFKRVDEQFKRVDERFQRVDKQFQLVNEQFKAAEIRVDRQFENLHKILMWAFGLLMTVQLAVLTKLFV